MEVQSRGQTASRVLWIDIARGLCILLVVLGHSTGLMNHYIYQFHVPAFFFLSGLVAHPERDGLGKTIRKRVFSLLLPLFTCVVLGAVLHTLLKLCGVYTVFYKESSWSSIPEQLVKFLTKGRVIDLLGTAWFALALFSASVVTKILCLISRGRKTLFTVLILAAYLGGYLLLSRGFHTGFALHLVPTCVGYFGAGCLCSGFLLRPDRNTGKNLWIPAVLLAVTSGIIWLLPRHFPGEATLDLGSGVFPNLPVNTLGVACGTVWVCSLSLLLEKIPFSRFRRALVFLGKNSFGIMLLHFLCFRLVSLALSWLNLIPLKLCRKLVPQGAAAPYWPLYFLFGALGSLLLWRLLARIPGLNSLLGENRKLQDAVQQNPVYQELRSLAQSIGTTLRSSFFRNREKGAASRSTSAETEKIAVLEGIRTIGWISIFFCHFKGAFFPDVVWWTDATPLRFFYAGNPYVRLLFVLSGFVMSLKYFGKGAYGDALSDTLKRYFRLMPPILVAEIAVCLMMYGGVLQNIEAAEVLGSKIFLGAFNTQKPNLLLCLREGLFTTYLTGANGYIGPLWTMVYEYLGSLLIIAAHSIFRKTPWRWLFYLVVLVFFNGYYNYFVLGMLVCDLYQNQGMSDKIRKNRPLRALMIIGGFLLMTMTELNAREKTTRVLFSMGLFFFFLGILNSDIAGKILGNRVMRMGAKISYSAYIVHWPIIETLSCGLFLSLYTSVNNRELLSWGIFIVTFLAIVIVSELLTKWVEPIGLRIGKAIARQMKQ